jgi:xylulokinase
VPVVLGVDSSTQATKVEVRDADDGRLRATGRAPHPSTTPPRSEQDPSAWWMALVDAVRQTGIRDVAAISVAAQQHGLVVLDAAGEVIRPAKLWNDTQSAPEAAAMVEQLGAEHWARSCGSVPVASFTITKLAWLARHEPEAFARVSMVLLPHDYLTHRLVGRFVTDRGDASGTGYWSPAENKWMPDLLARTVGPNRGMDLGIESLPDVLGPGESSGLLTDRARDELGLRGEIVCGTGTGDNMAAALGIGLRPGDVAVSIGTSGTVYTVTDAPTADPTGAVAGFADATGHFLPLVCTLNATGVTDAFARLLGVDRSTLGDLALHAPAGANGVVVVPYLDGERTPNRPEATGTIAGVRTDTDRNDLARAAFEGVVCGLLEGLDALQAAGAVSPAGERHGRMLLVGGGARSPAYQGVMADLAGADIVLPDGDEHVAAGACAQAAAVLHGMSPDEVAAQWGFGSGRTVAHDGGVERQAIRARYAAVRQ